MTTAVLNDNINWKIICIAAGFISMMLMAFYTWQIIDLTKGAYSVASYEQQISKLSVENKNLEVSFAENSFLGNALVKIQALNFQKTNAASVKYIQIPDNSVAIKK